MQATFVSYNPHDLYKKPTDTNLTRYELVYQVIRELRPDVLAIQELVGPEAGAGDNLRQLAEAVGMRCEHAPGKAAVAAGGNDYHTAILWADGIEPVPGSWRAYGRNDFWHSMGKITLDLGDTPAQFGSYHARPFGQAMRNGETERVVSNMTRPRKSRAPGLIGADWNSIGADTHPDGSYYDRDPYAGLPWRSANVYQCTWQSDNGEPANWHADRSAGEILLYGGLYDAAASLQAPWQPSAGHYGGEDPFGTRRIDAIRVTKDVLPALLHHDIPSTEQTRAASDHLPVVVTFDTAKMGTRPLATE